MMRRHFIITLLLCAGILQSADAQNFTQRLQKQTAGQGTVTIHQSDSIDQLVNSAVLGSKSTPAKPQASANNGTAAKSGGGNTANAGTAANSGTTETAQEDATPKASRGGYKTTGYRVQAFAGGNSRADRQQAERTGNIIRQHYPNIGVYVHFYSPRWICRVGNYRTYEEAHQMLVSLRNLGFNQATIVKGKITVAY